MRSAKAGRLAPHGQVQVYEVVHERDSVCVCVWDHVDAIVYVAVDSNPNANAPVYGLVDLYLTVDARRPLWPNGIWARAAAALAAAVAVAPGAPAAAAAS
jgi:hypothetical protein